MNNIFYKLHVEVKHLNNLRAADVLQITENSLQSHEFYSEDEPIQSFIQKLLMMNYRARYIKTKETNKQVQTHQYDSDSSKEDSDISDDIFRETSPSDQALSQSGPVHPMDVQMAVFHCADGFLKQLMVTKLSQCQYALPLLVPDPFTRQIVFPLWTFRQINKSWKIKNMENGIQPFCKAKTPMVCFFRFGCVSLSKSQLMNSLINEKHNTFFHRNCPGSCRTRELMDGVVEIAWFCPSGKNTDKFTDCVAFCNLHGDAGEHEKQLQILTEMSSVNVVLLPRLDRNDRHAAKIQNLYKDKKPLICLLDDSESSVIKKKKGKFNIGLKGRNQSDVSEELRRAINNHLKISSSTFKLEDVSKYSYITVDEENDDGCRRGREAAQQMIRLLGNKHLTEIKESFLPHQKLWHEWSQKNKELHRPQGENIEMDISGKTTQLNKIRYQQHEFHISDFIKCFIKEMNSYEQRQKMFFLKWLRILLDEHTSAGLSALHQKYHDKWLTVLKLKEKHDKSEQLKTKQTKLEKISEELQAATFGLEHIMREIGQIYESCSSVKENKKDLQFNFSSLPSLAAEMMVSGFPLELMDGDAAHVPLVWISAVLDELIQKLGDQTRVFVLSVLGIQSSGKSTMLNAMFGLEFAVSAGRCTRGAFMQLVKVSDEMKTQMNYDYILVVDTEGLHAPELAGRSTRDHDNNFATFVIGLANLTLINIFGENLAEMQDILQIVVQAFMRMKKVRLNPRCVFVHQNVADDAAGKKNMEGKRRLQEKLDEMTKLAAKEEGSNAECFSDVIKFDVQNDVKYFAQLWEGSPPMAPPNPNYCENIQELKKTIVSHASKSHRMNLTHLKDCIKDLWEALLKASMMCHDVSAMMKNENKLHNEIKIGSVCEVEETELQIELKSEKVEESMSEFFLKDAHAEILKKRTEERKQLENTLVEKSKELALKFKDKARDEETLKKEFDLIWGNSVKKTITDTDILHDVTLSRYKQGNKNNNILDVPNYNGYVILRNTYTKPHVKKQTLTPTDQDQIRSIIRDIVQETDKMIKSFKISEGNNIRYIQQLPDYIRKSVKEHQKKCKKYKFHEEFSVDLINFVVNRANENFFHQHELFKTFQNHCQRATMIAVFGKNICHNQKKPIEQNIYKKTARYIADEMRSNCESLKGNRSNLEKHILKRLAEEEDFNRYMKYIKTPRDHFKCFIRDEVSRYITNQFSVSVLPKMKENIKLLQKKIIEAAHQSTEHVQENRDVSLWLKSFTQLLSDELIFSEKDHSGVKHDDVDFKFLENVIKQELSCLMSEISSRFNSETLKQVYKDRVVDLLINHFSQCCWVQCPFCEATCTNDTKNHDGDHCVPLHRVTGINGDYYKSTLNLCTDICTDLVASNCNFNTPYGRSPLYSVREYRAGGVHTDWSITPDPSDQPYWKWFVCRFQKDLEKYNNKTFDRRGRFLYEWRRYTKQEAIESLSEFYQSSAH